MIGLAAPVFAQGVRDWGSCVVDGVPTLQCFEVIFGNIVFMFSTLIVFSLLVMLITGAFQYLTSFGDAGKIKKAQATLRFAIVGFVLFLSSFLILKIIDVLFLGNSGSLFELNLGS